MTLPRAIDTGLPVAVDNPTNPAWRDLREIVQDVWNYRDLLYQLTRRDVRVRYKQAVMGFAWAVLMPILIVSAGFLVRYAMATVAGVPMERTGMAGLVLKAIPWAFFAGAMSFATVSLSGNTSLVGKIYFPREVLPLSATLAQLVDAAIGAVAVTLALPFLGVSASWAMLWVLPLAVTLFVLTLAAALFLSCANLFFRDVKYIVQVLITFGIFFTPTLFEPAMLGEVGARLIMANPLAPLIEGFRLAIVEGHNLLEPLVVTKRDGASVLAWSPWYLAYSAAWAFGGLGFAAVLFHRLEYLFAEYI